MDTPHMRPSETIRLIDGAIRIHRYNDRTVFASELLHSHGDERFDRWRWFSGGFVQMCTELVLEDIERTRSRTLTTVKTPEPHEPVREEVRTVQSPVNSRVVSTGVDKDVPTGATGDSDNTVRAAFMPITSPHIATNRDITDTVYEDNLKDAIAPPSTLTHTRREKIETLMESVSEGRELNIDDEWPKFIMRHPSVAVFAKQIGRGGARDFLVCNYSSFIATYGQIPAHERLYNEVFLRHSIHEEHDPDGLPRPITYRPMRLAIDIELYLDTPLLAALNGSLFESRDAFLHDFCHGVLCTQAARTINRIMDAATTSNDAFPPIDPGEHFTILSACTSAKYSAHIICTHPAVYFASTGDVQRFVHDLSYNIILTEQQQQQQQQQQRGDDSKESHSEPSSAHGGDGHLSRMFVFHEYNGSGGSGGGARGRKGARRHVTCQPIVDMQLYRGTQFRIYGSTKMEHAKIEERRMRLYDPRTRSIATEYSVDTLRSTLVHHVAINVSDGDPPLYIIEYDGIIRRKTADNLDPMHDVVSDMRNKYIARLRATRDGKIAKILASNNAALVQNHQRGGGTMGNLSNWIPPNATAHDGGATVKRRTGKSYIYTYTDATRGQSHNVPTIMEMTTSPSQSRCNFNVSSIQYPEAYDAALGCIYQFYDSLTQNSEHRARVATHIRSYNGEAESFTPLQPHYSGVTMHVKGMRRNMERTRIMVTTDQRDCVIAQTRERGNTHRNSKEQVFLINLQYGSIRPICMNDRCSGARDYVFHVLQHRLDERLVHALRIAISDHARQQQQQPALNSNGSDNNRENVLPPLVTSPSPPTKEPPPPSDAQRERTTPIVTAPDTGTRASQPLQQQEIREIRTRLERIRKQSNRQRARKRPKLL